MEDGKRLENLSWRLWNRETFCCASEQSCSSPSRWKANRSSFISRASSEAIPSLASSMSSDMSSASSQREAPAAPATSSSLIPARPELRRLDSEESHNKGNEKHITPIDLQQIVESIKEPKKLEKLPPLPPSLTIQEPSPTHYFATTSPLQSRACDTTPRPSSPPRAIAPESSTSTVATTSSGYSGEMSPPLESNASTSTELSGHSVVHGFQLGRISSSIRSSSNLAPTPTPILKTSHSPAMKTVFSKNGQSKRPKQAQFLLGGSSGEEADSSLETRYAKSSLSDSIKRSAKTTSFKEEISTRQYESEEVFESDSEEESESAIEDDIDDDWEDEDDNSGPSSVNDHEMFKRVDSRPTLTSRRSLLTQAIHEPDRAMALQNLASRSTPAIRRSRTSTPNGPSLACSPREDAEIEIPEASGLRSKPIIMTTSNSTAPLPAMSPRTTRRNMLSTEMTESLRKHLLWERQQKNTTANAFLKRRHTSNDVKNLTQFPTTGDNMKPRPAGRLPPIDDQKTINSWSNNHFDSGLLEYHEKGW
jgi:hypothetical protein